MKRDKLKLPQQQLRKSNRRRKEEAPHNDFRKRIIIDHIGIRCIVLYFVIYAHECILPDIGTGRGRLSRFGSNVVIADPVQGLGF